MDTALSEEPQSHIRGLRVIHAAPLIPVFIVALIASRPIRDNSFLWHIRAGSYQLAEQQVITQDPFSYTFLGAPWRTQSWLLELFYARLESWTTSLVWANVFVFALGAATAALVGLAMYRSTMSPITTAFAMIGTVWLAGPFLQARPVILSYLLLAALVLVLDNKDRVLWLAVPIVWVWAAAHGSWVIGGGLILLEWARTRERRMLEVGVACLATTFVTAHGLGVWAILAEFARAQEALALMEEWMVPDFGDLVQAPYLLLIAGLIVAAMRQKIEPRDLIVVLPFLFFGMTSRRAVFPAAIVLAPFAARSIPAIRVPRSSLPPKLAGVVIGLFAMIAVLPMAVVPLGDLDPVRFPSETVGEALRGERFFHDDGVGGYLIWSEWPDERVYFDDRAELYGADMLREYREVTGGQYRDVFAERGFDMALSRPEWALTDALDRDGWIRMAEDEHFVVFQRP